MRFIRRYVDNPQPPERRCAFGCGNAVSTQIQINDFSIQTCRNHVDNALDMYLETRKATK